MKVRFSAIFFTIAVLVSFSACNKKKEITQWIFPPPDYDFSPEADNFQCQGMLSGQRCVQSLILVKHVDGEIKQFINSCCWRCEGGKSWCIRRRNAWPGKVLRVVEVGGGIWEIDPNWNLCDPIITSNDCPEEWALNSKPEYREFLEWLIRTYGAWGLEPEDVKLWGSHQEPPVDPNTGRITAGFADCKENPPAGWPKFVIYIYCHALAGKSRIYIYHTIAHEFQHVLQDAEHIDRYGSCSEPSNRNENEARNFADRIISLDLCE